MTSDLFTLPSEYQDLRDSVRALAEKEIAPHAHAVDEDHRFPQEASDALIKANLHAAHVPAEFGGEGADALAVVLIIEEVARVCASSSLIPAVNKLGSLPLMIGGDTEQKKRWLSELAKGKGFGYTDFASGKVDKSLFPKAKTTTDIQGYKTLASQLNEYVNQL